MDKRQLRLAERLERLRQDYLRQLPQRAAELQAQWDDVRASASKDALHLFYRGNHSLAGSAPSFGFTAVGKIARELESLCRAYLQQERWPEAAQLARIDTLMQALHQAVKDTEPFLREIIPPPSDNEDIGEYPGKERSLSVLMMEDDVPLAQSLCQQLQAFGYRVKILPNLDALREVVQQSPPDAIIADIVFPETATTGPEAICKLGESFYHNIPIIYISQNDDIESRLAALRAGGNAYLTKPLDPQELIDWLDTLTRFQPETPYRVMMMDDDASFTRNMSKILEAARIQVKVCQKPERMLETLRSFAPDVLLLDIHMPDCKGWELAEIIRQLSAFVTLPIVYLSAERSAAQQLDALLKGGDGFILKPILPLDLIRVVNYHARRYRQISDLLVRDSLTGLFNHRRIKEQLEIEVRRAQRQRTPLSFIMLDMDHFKSVNDTYGHAVGDQALRMLARFLQQSLRQSDLIGRYGGEEFAVILPNTPQQDAHHLFNKLCLRFAELELQSKTACFHLSFSGGVAGFPAQNSANGLIHSADKALYQAKHNGRRQIILAA